MTVIRQLMKQQWTLVQPHGMGTNQQGTSVYNHKAADKDSNPAGYISAPLISAIRQLIMKAKDRNAVIYTAWYLAGYHSVPLISAIRQLLKTAMVRNAATRNGIQQGTSSVHH